MSGAAERATAGAVKGMIMADRKVQRAVILAAGTGSRLVANETFPKPLKEVFEVPLLVRVLRTLQSEGIREAVIVVGYRGDSIKRALLAEPSLALTLHFVENPAYDRKNGVSLLAASEFIDQDVILSMADHLYSPEVVRRLKAFELPKGACALGIDYDIERCFDLDDATKVRLSHGRIADIGKDIGDYNCIDTGVFRIGPQLVAELERIYRGAGDVSLSDGVRALAAKGLFHGCDVGDARWIDVDTPEAFQRAEAMVRVFGDDLGDEPTTGVRAIDPEAMELFAPTWVRAAQPYREDHFERAESREGLARMMSNESPFAPSTRVVQAIIDAATRGNLYPNSGRELRRKLGEREQLGEANVVLGSGSTEIIDLVIRTFVAPGEEVLLSVPTFSMYEARTRVSGGIPVLVPMTEEHDFDVPAMLSNVTERTKVIFLCTPNNPTGNRIQESHLRRILRLGLPTVIDEAYHELGETGDSLSHMLAEFPNAILIRTFSKAFGLAGLRVGYGIAHASVVKLMLRVKVPWNLPATSIAAALAALDDVAEFEARMAQLREGRAFLVRELSRVAGFDVMPSEGNFVLIDAHGAGVPAEDILQAMFAEGVLIRSLSVHRAGRGFLRVTVGTASENARCVDTMRAVVSRLRRRGDSMGQLAVAVAASPGDAELERGAKPRRVSARLPGRDPGARSPTLRPGPVPGPARGPGRPPWAGSGAGGRLAHRGRPPRQAARRVRRGRAPVGCRPADRPAFPPRPRARPARARRSRPRGAAPGRCSGRGAPHPGRRGSRRRLAQRTRCPAAARRLPGAQARAFPAGRRAAGARPGRSRRTRQAGRGSGPGKRLLRRRRGGAARPPRRHQPRGPDGRGRRPLAARRRPRRRPARRQDPGQPARGAPRRGQGAR
jgi:histidinol-phosphate aminotransferase